MSEKIKTSPSTGWKTPQLNLTLCWPKTGKPFQAVWNTASTTTANGTTILSCTY